MTKMKEDYKIQEIYNFLYFNLDKMQIPMYNKYRN